MRFGMQAAVIPLCMAAFFSPVAHASSASLGLKVTIEPVAASSDPYIDNTLARTCSDVAGSLGSIATDWSDWRIGECSAKDAPLLAGATTTGITARP